MTAANIHRSKERSAGVHLRFAPEDREEIKRRAHELGLSVQDYADLRLLGRPSVEPRRPGRPKNTHQDEGFDIAI